MGFLDAAEEHGKEILTVINQQGQEIDPSVHNVSYEARLFKKMFLKLRD
jgi:tetrahydromethanopterin S-methyltransferase subunit F